VDKSAGPERGRGRLDQWLWFARLVKSRSLAARMCAAGVVAINDSPVRKPNQSVRTGDVLAIRFRGVERTLRVLALGTRRGPATEARMLYEEIAPPLWLAPTAGGWVPLLDDIEQSADRSSV
jgi:ribosome-associated heat shock protein Hsp15